MSNNRYLELDSTYRNRYEWPLPGEFQIPISQSGRKSREDALDPVSISIPNKSWTSNNLAATGATGAVVSGIIVPLPTPPPIIVSSDSICFIIETPINTLQQLDDYYVALVIRNTSTGANSSSSIIEYSYLYGDIGTGLEYAKIITTGLSYTPGDPFTISDPTDISNTSLPYFFVPDGSIQQNSYISYLLYNETKRESRHVISYDIELHLLRVDTTGTNSSISGPVTGWTITDNYSLRKENPIIPLPGTPYIPIVTGPVTYTPPVPLTPITYNTSTTTIILQGVSNITPENFYRNYSLRLVTKGTYNYPITPPINESRSIVKSFSFITGGINYLVLSVYPPFSGTPDPNLVNAEIMNFSYDNFNPFIYTGSVVSQQEMVCYEIELLNVILPNDTLSVGEGGRIAFYPYVYVTLSNVSSPGAGLKNIIYSNNPNSTNVTFRVPIDDIPNPLLSSFIKLDGNGMVQTIKFKPNDNLYFSVQLASGEIYNTVINDTLPPALPNIRAQISAMFSLRRL